jgi:AcrR family transcriptional regulator
MAGRRERRKAQTRADVRATAQRLFAEHGFDAVTIADVATAADVAVQTVFNHFESKEALFFDGRMPWIDGAVAAVTERAPGIDPVAALRRRLDADLAQVLEEDARPENRSFLEALQRSPALQARERTLIEQAGERLAVVLSAPITNGEWAAATTSDPAVAHVLSRLVADLFLAGGRVLVLENRRLLLAPEPDESRRRAVQAMATPTLTEVEHTVAALAHRLVNPSAGQPA